MGFFRTTPSSSTASGARSPSAGLISEPSSTLTTNDIASCAPPGHRLVMSVVSARRLRLVVHLLRLHRAQELRVDEGVVVDGLRELALLLQLALGQLEHGNGRVLELHVERELGHELLDHRRIQVLEEVGDVLGGLLPVL